MRALAFFFVGVAIVATLTLAPYLLAVSDVVNAL